MTPRQERLEKAGEKLAADFAEAQAILECYGRAMIELEIIDPNDELAVRVRERHTAAREHRDALAAEWRAWLVGRRPEPARQ